MDFSIDFSGFTKLLNTFKTAITNAINPALETMTDSTGKLAFGRYQENLAGSYPSTADNPLPVGMITGELYASADLIIEDAKHWRLINYAAHAGYIEDGTATIAPRHPLQAALDSIDKPIKAAQAKAMTAIINAEGADD